MKVKKKLWKKVGPYTIYLVDGALLRETITMEDVMKKNVDYTMADFLDYGIHGDTKKHNGDRFPQIPKNEIWVSEQIDEFEKNIALLTAYKHLELSKKEGPEKAYNHAMDYEEELRKKFASKKHQDVHLKKYTSLGDGKSKIIVWVVDGEAVRDRFDENYIQGGHGYVYNYVPKNEIWLDNTLKGEEFPGVLTHEYVEMCHMRDGMKYDDAHKIATKAEYGVRKKL